MTNIWQPSIPLGAVQITESRLLNALNGVFMTERPRAILVGAPQAAALRAHVDFQGRDRRRIKREVNKAMRRARRPK